MTEPGGDSDDCLRKAAVMHLQAERAVSERMREMYEAIARTWEIRASLRGEAEKPA